MEDISKIILTQNNFNDFNEVQKKCLDKLNNSLIVSAPTASGKTIIAELFLLKEIIINKKKVIYTCPLRALASEHYKDFKKKYPKIKLALSTGDFDSSSSYLKKFDCIFTTYEKLSSLLRHKANWINDVGCLIVDEIHELDSDRGVVLEIAITQMKMQLKEIKILGLSATIPNAKELSEWLNAKLVESDWRPTKLRQGISFDDEIEFLDGEKTQSNLNKKIDEFLNQKKQALVFLNSRKRAEEYAKKITAKTIQNISEKDKKYLDNLSEKILGVLESPTSQCYLLSECVKKGSAFHHAGLISKQRELIEENFKKGKIHIICATTTLAAGINTAADLVVIPSLYRYSGMGMDLIPTREYLQMVGRSGRPKFSKEGQSLVQANNEMQKDLYLEKYLKGKAEPIVSKLGQEAILRIQILGLIATNTIYNDKSIIDFFKQTLFVKQQKSISSVYENVSFIIDELKQMNFVKYENDMFFCTPIGKRVSDLFLEPKSAYLLINSLKIKKPFSEISYFFIWSKMTEFLPLISMPKKINPIIMKEFNENLNNLPISKEDLYYLENDSITNYFNTIILNEWINEKKEQELFSDFGLMPGVLFGKTKIIEWLAYSTIELSKTINEERHVVTLNKLSLRVKYGVREELLPLVELKGIGRIRARKLFRAGIKKPSDIKNNLIVIEKLFGEKILESLKKQLKII